MTKIISFKTLSISILLIILNYLVCLFYFVEIKYQNYNDHIYVLDDAYIHLSMAKNFHDNGNWAIQGEKFTNSSSSPLWTYLISILGPDNYLIPFYLNILFGSVLIASFYIWLLKNNVKEVLAIFISLIFIFIVPIIPLYFTGLEHILHILIMSILLLFILRYFQNRSLSKIIFLLLVSLSTIFRLESIFLIIPFIIYQIFTKDYKNSIATFLAMIIPYSILGLISINNGWFFFPNSIYLKSVVILNFWDNILYYLIQIPKHIYLAPHTGVIIFIATALVFISFKRKLRELSALNSILLGFYLLFLEFGRIGWFFRYEAFLIALFIIQIILNIPKIKEYINQRIIVLILLLISIPFITRGYESYSKITIAAKNVYSQPIQIAEFINKYYNNSEVGLNDIGAVSYMTNAKIIDLIGLANIDIAKLKKQNKFSFKDYQSLIKNTEFIAVFDNWFSVNGRNEINWIKVGFLEIEDNYILGNEKISFYANDSLKAVKLKQNLIDFIPYLNNSARIELY